MKLIKRITPFILVLVTAYTASAQKQTYDVLTYNLPKNWQQNQSEGGVQLSVTDKNTGAYAMAVITKAIASGASAADNFTNQWDKLVKSTVNVSGNAAMQAPEKDNGWNILSGSASYIDGASKGTATLLCATGGGQTVSVVLMTNTQQYQSDLLSFINSLKLSKAAQSTNNNAASSTTTNGGTSSIAGLWVNYTTESNGYANGFPVVTGGYFRREYLFYTNGTYQFRAKDWGVFMSDILFIYETGTWKITGNQLTITPKQGRGEWWGKAANGSTSGWGSRKRVSDYKSETVTYTFDMHYYSGMKETYLELVSNRATARDARGTTQPYKWSYSPRALDKSLIDNPPGFKTGFENKSLTGDAPPKTTIDQPVNNNSLIAGKIWEGTSTEKYKSGSASYNTGGFFTYQYRFNADGTYKFVYVGASAYTDPNTLQRETGTYTINGNQLTITPSSGSNEEWSIVGGPVKMSAMSDVQIRSIKEHWGKQIKTEKRKLEKITYPFKVEYQQGNQANALILQYNGHTEREGNGNVAYYFETTAGRSIKLP